MNLRHISRLAALGSISALVLAACGNVTPSAPPPSPATLAPSPASSPTPIPTNGDLVFRGHIVRWFVGLGTGNSPAQEAVEKQIVSDFNAQQETRPATSQIWLVLEAVSSVAAPEILRTEIASGNAPDLIGPMGPAGRARCLACPACERRH